jgi:hypothetical protein
MSFDQILIDLDREIAKLQQARALLSGTNAEKSSVASTSVKRKPGRPVGSGKLSPEGRSRIAEAMKRSWARRKKKAAANVAKK